MIRVFDKVLEHIPNPSVVVEVGSIRHVKKTQSGGHSTLEWPRTSLVFSCDTNPSATLLTKRMTQDRPLTFVRNMDGLKFLEMFPVYIDILYLDGPFDKLKAYQLAQHKLSVISAVLIDDINIGRDRPEEHPFEAIELMKENGYIEMEYPESKQAFLLRKGE